MDRQKRFKEALRAATSGSVEKVAREAGYSRTAFDLYANRRNPSKAALRALAEVLRNRAALLLEHAEGLEAAADEAER
jgi:transcriptional regulator with XRE-family HTH domain